MGENNSKSIEAIVVLMAFVFTITFFFVVGIFDSDDTFLQKVKNKEIVGIVSFKGKSNREWERLEYSVGICEKDNLFNCKYGLVWMNSTDFPKAGYEIIELGDSIVKKSGSSIVQIKRHNEVVYKFDFVAHEKARIERLDELFK